MVHRIRFYWFLLRWGVWPTILTLIGVVGFYDTVAAQFFPDNKLPKVINVMSWWDWRYWVILLLVVTWIASAEGSYRREKKKEEHSEKENIKQIVDELLTIGIYEDKHVNITRILYKDREKLAVGLPDDVTATSIQDKLVLHQLNLRNIVQLEQRKEGTYGSANVRDKGYWILTELGKDIILYLQKNPQVLDNEGSLSQEL